jgi:hypothetical protein
MEATGNRQKGNINLLKNLLNRVVLSVSKQPKHLLVLRLTALLLLLYSPTYSPLDEYVLPIFCGTMLVYPKLLLRRWMWGIVFVFFVWTNIHFWFQFDNHHYLTNYWCLVCTLAVQAKNREEVMEWNGKLLIGLCFLLATFWKAIGAQYFDGSFLHLTFLLDDRLEMGAFLFGGLNSEVLQNNRSLFYQLQESIPGTEATLTTSPLLALVTLILSYWTLLCEGAIAIAFLSPRPKWLHERRDWLLIFFIFTTYPFTPIVGFAALLTVMGFAQCSPNYPKRLLIYLALFLLIPLWVEFPQMIVNYFRP